MPTLEPKRIMTEMSDMQPYMDSDISDRQVPVTRTRSAAAKAQVLVLSPVAGFPPPPPPTTTTQCFLWLPHELPPGPH